MLTALQNGEQFPEYYKEVTNPLDLSIIATMVDNKEYTSAPAFLEDINIVVQNAVDHNPGNDPTRPNRVMMSHFID